MDLLMFVKRKVEYAIDEGNEVINKNRSITDRLFIILLGMFLLILVSERATGQDFSNNKF